ncbi:SAM-dependent methyltransferase [Actinophytocola sediminis]
MSTERPSWAPEDIDLERPNAARVYDYLLGGMANFAKDREFAERLTDIAPEAAKMARSNRAFLRRAVTHCLDNGIRQFLDIGSGIPTAGNVHEIAQRIEPSAKVVYVDIEPVAVTHTELMLADNENADVVRGELLEQEALFSSEPVRRLLNFDEPIAVLMVSVLHFIEDDAKPYAAVARYIDAVVPGSFLVISHIAAEDTDEQSKARQLYQKNAVPIVARTSEQVAKFFTGMDLVEPGVVWTPQWHPEVTDDVVDPFRSKGFVGVARKP